MTSLLLQAIRHVSLSLSLLTSPVGKPLYLGPLELPTHPLGSKLTVIHSKPCVIAPPSKIQKSTRTSHNVTGMRKLATMVVRLIASNVKFIFDCKHGNCLNNGNFQ
jgi:hypothetical protein